MQDSNRLSESYELRQRKKEGLTDKFRQKLNVVGRRTQVSQPENVPDIDLSYLTQRSQVRKE